MQELLNTIGLSQQEFINIAIIAVVALIALGILRSILKLTATILRLGCAVIILGVIAMTFISMLN